MTTVQQVYEVMQRLAPPELAEHWDNPGLLVDCGGAVRRVLVTLDITPEVVAEAAAKQCTVIVAHHPVIFDPLKRLCPADVPYQLVRAGISAICMHTNLDAAEGGVNDVLADLFGIRQRTAFADGCGRVGDIDPITVPELAALAQHKLAALCNAPDTGAAVQVKAGAPAGSHQRRGRQSVCRSHRRGRGLSADRRSQPPPCTGRQAAGTVPHCGGALRHRVPGNRRRGICPARRPAGGRGAGEHREPRPVYLFIKREPSPSLLRNATSPERGRSFSINRKRAKAPPQATERVIDKTR